MEGLWEGQDRETSVASLHCHHHHLPKAIWKEQLWAFKCWSSTNPHLICSRVSAPGVMRNFFRSFGESLMPSEPVSSKGSYSVTWRDSHAFLPPHFCTALCAVLCFLAQAPARPQNLLNTPSSWMTSKIVTSCNFRRPIPNTLMLLLLFSPFFFTKYTNSYIFISNHTVIAFRKDVTCTSPFIPSVWDLPPIRTPPHPTSQYSAVSASGLRACPEQGTSLELKSYRTYGVWVFASLWLQLLFTSICTASRTVPTKRESLHMPPSYAHCLRLYWPASDDQNTGY